MNKLFLLIAIGFSLFISACVSQPYFLLKNHHFDSPEARGDKFKLSASVTPYQDLTTVVTSVDYSTPDPEATDAFITKNSKDAPKTASGFDHSSAIFNISLAERMDFSVDFALGNQPNFFTGRYQFIGDTRANATEGNFSLSGILGLGVISVKDEDNIVLNSSVTLDSFEVTGYAVRTGAVLGLRSTKDLLVYWSNSATFYDAKTKYNRDLLGTKSSGSFSTTGTQLISMLGLEYTFMEKISVNVEYGLVFADADRADSTNFSSFAGKVGYNF